MPSLVRPNGAPRPRIWIDELRGIGRVELHRRDQFLQAVHVEGADALDQRAVYDRERNRHFLCDFLDAPRGHDDRLREARGYQLHVEPRPPSWLQHDAPD